MDDAALTALLADVKTIAVVGCSRYPYKAAHAIPKRLQELGYRIVPVSPHADELLGERVYPSLADVDVPVDLVDVFRPAHEAPDVVRQAVEMGAPRVWLQLGITSADARAIAEQAGIGYVEDRCLGVDVTRLGLRPG
ncbi:MAG TPA: CoA-binding protein [Egibacteraceae bacterium]